jgi:hypothetical protein
MKKMTFDSLLSEIRKMKREQRLDLFMETVWITALSATVIAFAALSFKAFWWTFSKGEDGILIRGALFIAALMSLYQCGKFCKLSADNIEYERIIEHRRILRELAQVEKRFRIYKRAFEIKKELLK